MAAFRGTIAGMGIGSGYTVWLIGAGFSQALGGPLLADLFRPRALEDDQSAFPDSQYRYVAWDLHLSRSLCKLGQQEGRWSNAEEFLSYVDSAHRETDRRRKDILQLMWRRMKSTLPRGTVEDRGFTYARARFVTKSTGVRRAIAAECSAFLEERHDQEEIWEPYRRWAATLNPHSDTVISFNYDLTLEKLATRPHSNLKVVLPQDVSVQSDGRAHLATDIVPVLKLHGSVDWFRGSDGATGCGNMAEMWADEERVPVIAAPGRSKQDAVKELEPLWKAAQDRLRRCNSLVIVGYGFPASDARARIAIQDAFRDGGTTGEVRRIDVVLGPDNTSPNFCRIHALLEAFDPRRRLVRSYTAARQDPDSRLYLKVHRLWAQDFIVDYVDRTRER